VVFSVLFLAHPCVLCDLCGYDVRYAMRYILRFLWNATRGHRLTPWRSPYLLWRVETYCGVKMQQIGFLEFWEFVWRERSHLWRFLKWTAEMERYVRPVVKSS
jgi:hypothetical protein